MKNAQSNVKFGRFSYDPLPRERRSGDPPPQKAEKPERTATPPNAAGKIDGIAPERAAVNNDPPGPLMAKFEAIQRLDAYLLPANPMASIVTGAWLLSDGLLGVALLAYGITYGISGTYYNSSQQYDVHRNYEAMLLISQYWGGWSDKIELFVIWFWVISVILALISLRKSLRYWVGHSAAKFPAAIGLIVGGILTGLATSSANTELLMTLVRISVYGGLIWCAGFAARMGYEWCRYEIAAKCESEKNELMRQMAALVPGVAAAPAEPVVYDNIID